MSGIRSCIPSVSIETLSLSLHVGGGDDGLHEAALARLARRSTFVEDRGEPGAEATSAPEAAEEEVAGATTLARKAGEDGASDAC
mmetsp:Transcript_37321/g.96727  ORF Transcript_37321/g.96727 Transcript_37321/m.96727 type:complete len:85 (+) Transcript_37321:551-805(+)